MIVYDWKNPANGPIRKPGSVQFLGLSGGSIEAAGKGAIDYVIARGYPANKIIVGLPFYSSDNRSWFNGAAMWATNRIGFLNATDPDYLETRNRRRLVDNAGQCETEDERAARSRAKRCWPAATSRAASASGNWATKTRRNHNSPTRLSNGARATVRSVAWLRRRRRIPSC